ncbi:MAG: dihydropteroate synthase [Candidatus Omnitrophica bacterium]|nr:dihydropteroate synthase [Candidatus Omnitrophota bacterium]
MQILELHRSQDLRKLMQEIKVDDCGINIMLPKAITHLVRVNSISNIAANILKQELLSLGADAAIARDSLTGKTKKTDCLLMGNLSQFNRLSEKLKIQPFGLNRLSKELSEALSNYQKERFCLKLGKYKIDINRRTRIMGIVNLTPDSFSGDGLYRFQKTTPEWILNYAKQLIVDGADIIDIGGQSSRPESRPVPLKEELSRVIPVIKLLAKKVRAPVSIDTSKPEVAKQALDNGASLVNDITGLDNPKMRQIVSRYKSGVVIMHMKGSPRTMQKNPSYNSLIEDIINYLSRSLDLAVNDGIDINKIIIDPGIGFGKTTDHNLEILRRLSEFKILGRPILVGTSRKSFIGKILDKKPHERLSGTLSSCVLAAKNGANIVRVHDVKQAAEALKITDAILYS